MSQMLVRWWWTEFGEEEADAAREAVSVGKVSQGTIVEEFETQVSRKLNCKHVIAVSNGSAALLTSIMALQLRPGSQVLVPDRTWIGTAHAIKIAGLLPIPVDTEVGRPVMSISSLEERINKDTTAVIPVHFNGRNANIEKIMDITRHTSIKVVEDSAQALMVQQSGKMLGTFGNFGCFSLSVAKLISTGQGGFLATNDEVLANRARKIRTHGVGSTIAPGSWEMLGFNFRFTDIQAAIGLVQIRKIEQRQEKMISIYRFYERCLNPEVARLVPCDVDNGEIPIYIEVECLDPYSLSLELEKYGIETRPYYPPISMANYMVSINSNEINRNSNNFYRKTLYLPSGPSIDLDLLYECGRRAKLFIS
jgi:perosamine synthetase